MNFRRWSGASWLLPAVALPAFIAISAAGAPPPGLPWRGTYASPLPTADHCASMASPIPNHTVRLSPKSPRVARLAAAAVPSPSAPVVLPTPQRADAEPRTTTLLASRWLRIPSAPVPGPYVTVAALDDHIVIIDRTGVAAALDVASNRWRTLGALPRSLASSLRGSTGFVHDNNIYLFGVTISANRPRFTGAVLDAADNRWHSLARAPEMSASMPLARPYVAGVTDLGGAIVVASSDGTLATYTPSTACWLALPPTPARDYLSGLYRTSSSIVVDLRGPDGLSVARYDDAGWSAPITILDDPMKASSGAIPFNDLLYYITWHDGGLTDPTNVLLDPATGHVRRFDHKCTHLSGIGAVRVGDLAIEGNARFGIRLTDGQCVAIPTRNPSLLGGSLIAVDHWLVYLSGGTGDLEPYRTTGFKIAWRAHVLE